MTRGDGLKPIGYGVDSVSATIEAVSCIEAAVGKNPARAHEIRLELRDTIDKRGLIATPENAFINELVHEAARASIRADGDMVFIDYDPVPKIRLKHGS